MNIKNFKSMLKSETKININNNMDKIEYQNHSPQTHSIRNFRFIWGLASFVLLVVISFITYLNLHPVATLRIEFNPQITITINKFNKIIEVESNNQEGMTMIDDINLVYDDLETAIEKIYNYSINKGYTVNDQLFLLYGIESTQDKYLNQIKSLIEASETESVKAMIVNTLGYDTSSIQISYESDDLIIIPEISDGTEEEFDSNDSTNNNQFSDDSKTLDDVLENYLASDLKLSLVIEIFNNNPNYSTIEDFEELLSMSFSELYNIYK